MNRNSFMTLFTIFTISSFAMLDQGQAQTETRLEPTGNSFIKLGDIKGEYMKLGDIKGEYMKLGDIKGEYMKLGDIKGEFMSAPWLGGIAVGTPGDEFTNAGDDDKIQQSSDDHYEVLFAGFNFLHVIPGGGVLEGIAAACYQLRLEGMSDNED
jgi:hypothetical protein